MLLLSNILSLHKSYNIFLFTFQKTELKLEDKDYKEIQRDVGDDVHYWNRTVGLYLVIEASNGVMLIWDKKTTVFIKLTPDYKVRTYLSFFQVAVYIDK